MLDLRPFVDSVLAALASGGSAVFAFGLTGWGHLLYWLGWPLVGLFARMMLRTDRLAHAPMPPGPKIIAVNHPSNTDPFLTLLLLRQRVSIMITHQAFKVPVFGSYLRRAGHICVTPGEGQAALDRAAALLHQGRTVVIFPEGLISPREGGFHRARTGVARLALCTGAPVVPIGIHLPRERRTVVLPHLEGQDELGQWYLRGPYLTTVGHAMRFEGDVNDWEHVVSVAQKIMERIKGLAHQSQLRMNGR
jgi:1-acyl-sn-glycerol-3-phosphate acyltransferase